MSTAPSLKQDLLKFTLKALRGPHAGMTLEFEKSVITIGRGPENDIQLNLDPRVSRAHVEIRQSLQQFYIVNLSQKNFVLLNGKNITSEKLEHRAVFQLGETEFMFVVHQNTDLLEPLSLVSTAQPSPASPVRMTQLPPSIPPSTTIPQAVSQSYPPQQNLQGWSPVPPPARAPHNSAQIPNRGAAPAFKSQSASSSSGTSIFQNKRFKIYGGVLLVGLLIFVSLPKTTTKKANERIFRSAEELDLSRQQIEQEMQSFKDKRERKQQTIYQKSNENFLRGYRDYRQGQYARAKEAFQVVLNLDPENELAKRYYNLAQIKLDEVIKFHMLQGRRYFEKQNYRLCRANYQTAMTMLGNDLSNPEYKEAKVQHERCSLALEGKM